MKKLLKKPHRIVLLSVLLIVIVGLAVYFTPSYFNMQADNDTNHYTSGKSFMTYCDGELVVDDHEYDKIINSYNEYYFSAPEDKPDFEYTDIYSKAGKKHILTPQNSQIIKDKMVYNYHGKLYYKNINADGQMLVAENCDEFYYNDENIVFASGNDLYVSEITGDEKANNKKLHTFSKEESIDFMQTSDNKLYLTTYNDSTDESTIQYNFYIFHINTMSMEKSCYCIMPKCPENIFICNGKFIYNHKGSSAIFTADFKNNDQIILAEHNNIVAITSNGEKVYLASEKVKTAEFLIETAKADTNGIWELDVTTGEKKKISDECVIEDLLATENYVYCYAIDYKVPRGLTSFVYGSMKNYKILQIPIN